MSSCTLVGVSTREVTIVARKSDVCCCGLSDGLRIPFKLLMPLDVPAWESASSDKTAIPFPVALLTVPPGVNGWLVNCCHGSAEMGGFEWRGRLTASKEKPVPLVLAEGPSKESSRSLNMAFERLFGSFVKDDEGMGAGFGRDALMNANGDVPESSKWDDKLDCGGKMLEGGVKALLKAADTGALCENMRFPAICRLPIATRLSGLGASSSL